MAAIVDRESLGGEALKPQSPAGFGDGGHGRGLAQVDDRYHESFITARFDDAVTPIWTDPTFNILYGARLLANAHRLTGSWLVSVAAYNAGLTRATRASRTVSGNDELALLAALDRATTGGNYVSDVLRRRDSFIAGAV